MPDTDDKLNILTTSPIFRNLSEEAREAIYRSVEHRTVPRGTILFREGDPGDSFYIINSGRVRIFRRNERGMEIDISVQGEGQAFGEMSLLTGEPRSADVVTLEDTHFLVVPKDRFDRLLHEYPDITVQLFKEMRRWLVRNEERREMEVLEEYEATRLSWIHFFLVISVSVMLAVIFNISNPNGIPLFPEFPDKNAIPVISPIEAMAEVREGRAVVLDASPPNFYQKRHIKGAVSIPLSLFDIVYMMTFSEEDKEKRIVVYGRTISKLNDLEVAHKLLLRGYKNVNILDGGLSAWEKLGYPVEEKARK